MHTCTKTTGFGHDGENKHGAAHAKRRLLHFHPLPSVFYYLLGGERLRPVVENQPVFTEGFGLCRRFLALLPVCDFTVLVHG